MQVLSTEETYPSDKFHESLLREVHRWPFVEEVFDIEIHAYLDKGNERHLSSKSTQQIEALVMYVLTYLYNILLHSNSPKIKQGGGFPFKVCLCVWWHMGSSECKIHVYLNDSVIGLVYGISHKYIKKFYGTLYAIMSKTGQRCEVKVLPLSERGNR